MGLHMHGFIVSGSIRLTKFRSVKIRRGHFDINWLVSELTHCDSNTCILCRFKYCLTFEKYYQKASKIRKWYYIYIKINTFNIYSSFMLSDYYRFCAKYEFIICSVFVIWKSKKRATPLWSHKMLRIASSVWDLAG